MFVIFCNKNKQGRLFYHNEKSQGGHRQYWFSDSGRIPLLILVLSIFLLCHSQHVDFASWAGFLMVLAWQYFSIHYMQTTLSRGNIRGHTSVLCPFLRERETAPEAPSRLVISPWPECPWLIQSQGKRHETTPSRLSFGKLGSRHSGRIHKLQGHVSKYEVCK